MILCPPTVTVIAVGGHRDRTAAPFTSEHCKRDNTWLLLSVNGVDHVNKIYYNEVTTLTRMPSNHIRVSKETYKELNGMKDQGDTFDDVVSRLLEGHNDNDATG